jgi:hypothetical protein
MMTPRRFVLIAAIAAILLGAVGCALLVAEGNVEITSWDQNYYEYLERYGLVEVYFTVRNTGMIDIDYYKVWFEVECADGSRYQEWTNGLGVSPGMYVSDSTLIDVADKRAVNVRVTDFTVENWDL